MKLLFDREELTFNGEIKNIVDLCEKNNIEITAPCYKSGRIGGCCSACAIEVDGRRAFACATKPKDGMKIVYNREDLITERQEKLIAYEKTLKEGNSSSCCNCSCNGC